MGTCQSTRVRGTPDGDGHTTRPPFLGNIGPEFAASIDRPMTPWDREPRVVLANKSSYCVSYSVAQQDKKKTTLHQETIAKSVGLHLNASLTDAASLGGDMERKREETTHTEEVEKYYLMRDHRMEPEGRSKSTQVAFPAKCEEVLVLAFFKDGEDWLPFKNKVYSISRKDKIFKLTALDPNITPYARTPPPPPQQGETHGETPGSRTTG